MALALRLLFGKLEIRNLTCNNGFFDSSKNLIFATFGLLVLSSPLVAQESDQEDIPLYMFEDLKLDTSKLLPHRLVYNPIEGGEKSGDGTFLEGMFPNGQINMTLERTLYYDQDKMPKDAIRVRWVANTHPHTDALVVDAKTLGTRNEITRSSRNWETSGDILHVRDKQARITTFSDKEEPTRNFYDLQYDDYYGLMIFPYLFAVMDVPVGTTFRLPGLGPESEATFIVDVVGPSTFIDNEGIERKASLVTTRLSWADIDWYVKEDPPYHLHAVWKYKIGRVAGRTATSMVIDWDLFEADTYKDIIDLDAHKNAIGSSQ